MPCDSKLGFCVCVCFLIMQYSRPTRAERNHTCGMNNTFIVILFGRFSCFTYLLCERVGAHG